MKYLEYIAILYNIFDISTYFMVRLNDFTIYLHKLKTNSSLFLDAASTFHFRYVLRYKKKVKENMMNQLIGTFKLKTKEEILELPDWEKYRYGKSLRNSKRNDYIHRTSYHLLGEKVDVYWVTNKYINSYDIVPHATPHNSDSTETIYYLSDYTDLVKGEDEN